MQDYILGNASTIFYNLWDKIAPYLIAIKEGIIFIGREIAKALSHVYKMVKDQVVIAMKGTFLILKLLNDS